MDRPRLLFQQNNELTECPVWDDRTQTLYWVDIVTGRLFRSRLKGADAVLSRSWTEPEEWKVSDSLGAIGLAEDGRLVGALGDRIALLAWKSEITPLCQLPVDSSEVVCNDGKVGPDGRFWIGTKDRRHRSGLGKLFRVSTTGEVSTEVEGLVISNGLDWFGTEFYLADSIPRSITRYSWDSGSLRGGVSKFPELGPEWGVPDGLCIDQEGCLWSARWGANRVVRLSPAGEILSQIQFPTSRVSSCSFVGPQLETLVVTTAREDLTQEERSQEPLAGSVFAVDVEVLGRKGFRFQ